jgi:formiminotetrahydrofolate cyclodeaminase
MSDTLWSQNLSAFRDAIASTEPTPGGGSVSMVSATFGLGLVIMALEITAKKPERGAEGRLAELLAEGRRLLAELSAHADEDVTVFLAYMAAFKLPKATDPEKAARKQALQEALVKATRAPLTAARSCVAALDLAEKSATASSVRVVSDVGAGAALLGGAVSAELLNVDINVPSVTDAGLKGEFTRDRTELNTQAAAKAKVVLDRVGERIASGK